MTCLTPRRRANSWWTLLLAAAMAGALAGALSACSASLLPKPVPPPARFTLDAAAAAEAPAAPTPASVGAPVLVVDVPRAAPGFDSRQMVYRRQAQQLEAYAFHEWVDTPARMLAPLMVRSLQQREAFAAVLAAPSAGVGTLRLESELIRLQQDFGAGPSRVRLTLRAVLVDSATRRVVAWREFDASVAAASDDAPGGAAAAQQAAQQVLAALAAFCADQSTR